MLSSTNKQIIPCCYTEEVIYAFATRELYLANWCSIGYNTASLYVKILEVPKEENDLDTQIQIELSDNNNITTVYALNNGEEKAFIIKDLNYMVIQTVGNSGKLVAKIEINYNYIVSNNNYCLRCLTKTMDSFVTKNELYLEKKYTNSENIILENKNMQNNCISLFTEVTSNTLTKLDDEGNTIPAILYIIATTKNGDIHHIDFKYVNQKIVIYLLDIVKLVLF